MNGHVIPNAKNWWHLVIRPLFFLGGTFERSEDRGGLRLKDSLLHFDLSKSNLPYESICRLILLSMTWSTCRKGKVYDLNFHSGKVNT